MPVRTLVVWCLDWPVVAAGVPLDQPAAVIHANRVVACSPAARAEQVVVGLRRREAQGRCPHLVVLEHDPALYARRFEPVVAAVETLAPRIEITLPGTCALATRGPSRYFGGDVALAERVHGLVVEVLGHGHVQVGIADGPFAARLAARHTGRATELAELATGRATELAELATGRATRVVPPGGTPAFLAPLPVGTLDRPDLVDVLVRLGLHTLGDLAALPEADLVARFGLEGQGAHRLASGRDERPPATRRPPPDLTVAAELEPPAERVDQAAFVGKALADELHEGLAARGLACSRIAVEVETEHGERLERLWRHEGALTAAAIGDRIRWQVDGWLNGSAAVRPTSGITRLALTPEEVLPARGRQLGFWGGEAAAADRAARALARVQGILGAEAVTLPEPRGGRVPAEQLAMVPVDAVDLAGERADLGPDGPDGPWPGQVPPPSPAVVHLDPLVASLVDDHGVPVRVSGRGTVSGAPARVSIDGAQWDDVVGWAGPWPLDQRWWDPRARRRQARFQVHTATGAAHLLALEAGRWWCEATYD